MNQAPPDLPPMKPAPAAPGHAETATPSGSAFRHSSPGGGAPVGRRLRQMVTVVASGGFALTLSIGVLEMIARPEFRPTTLLSTIEGRTHLGMINQTMGMGPGELPLTEADYRAKLAEAERGGQTKAELAFQTRLAGVQADKERVVQAYGALYQRTNIIAQAGVQMEGQAQQFRQQLIAATNGGRAVVIGLKDVACGLGEESACASARADRENMIGEGTALTGGDLAAKVNALMAGIPDPASLVAAGDQRQNGIPTLMDR